MHPSIVEAFTNGLLTAQEVAGARVLEVGSYDVNGSVRPVVERLGPASYTGVDASPGPRVDQVVNCVDLLRAFGPDTFDIVISTEMLEHAGDWRRCIVNMAGVLVEGGLLVITTRGPGFPYHGFPEDFWRFTPEVMDGILGAIGFEVFTCVPDPDPMSPGVIAKAAKPAGWEIPEESVLLEPSVQPARVEAKPLSIFGYPHQADGSGYYRFYLPYKHLARNASHYVHIPAPGTKITPTDEDVALLDVIACQRFMGTDGIGLFERWKGRTALVYETDDDILNPDPSAGLAHLHDPMARESFVRCLRMADMVTVSTEPLAEQMRRFNGNVRILPNFIHGDMLYMERPRADRLTLGWAGGMSHLLDWTTISDPVRDVLERNPAADFHFVGIDYSPLLKRTCRFTPWKVDVWDYFRRLDFDIGVIPLAHTPFNRCKSHIKALEFMALGIPVVAANQPAYNELVVDGVTGFLIDSEEQWRDRLTDLIHDEAMRTEMGAKGREIAAQWTIQQGWKLWRDAYEEVTGWHP